MIKDGTIDQAALDALARRRHARSSSPQDQIKAARTYLNANWDITIQ